MAKILGGSASRTELYGLFIAAVILIGGGVSGAVALTSSDQTPSEAVAESEVERTESDAEGTESETSPTDDESAQESEGSGPSTSVGGWTGSSTGPAVGSVGSSTETTQPRTTVSIAGLSEDEARIVQEYVAKETEAQRQARLERERQVFREANPAGRFIGSQILSCTPMQIGAETIQLVEYQLRYEAYQPLSLHSYVNPGLSVYQGERQQLVDAVNSGFRIQPQRVDINLSSGLHSVVLHGLLFPSGGVPYVEVRFQAADWSTYGNYDADLPLPGRVCG